MRIAFVFPHFLGSRRAGRGQLIPHARKASLNFNAVFPFNHLALGSQPAAMETLEHGGLLDNHQPANRSGFLDFHAPGNHALER